MNALTLVFTALCVFAIGYRFYGLFIATKVLKVNASRSTPAEKMADGVDYVKTNKFVLFGHHFAAIAAAGPLLGPVLAAQFGYLPGALWILIGAVLGGAVHDMVVLFASVRHKGRSLAYIAAQEVDKFTGSVASIAVLFILILTLAGLSIACVNAMFSSPWATFTIAATMPIAIIMGIYMHLRPGSVAEASILGVVLLLAAVVGGHWVAQSATLGPIFTLSKNALSIAVPVYGVFASALPVWLLLLPRDYLSTYLKIGTIAMLTLGLVWVHPDLRMDAVSKFFHGGGPIIAGAAIPFLFITIACGAISGFHAIIATGTTPKMLDSEKNLLFVGYGAMLTEGFVAIMALIAATSMFPADYFAINSTPEVFKTLGMATVDLTRISTEVGETLYGRTGGAVSLAVGMAEIFRKIPFMDSLVAYWYHFAVMFEAVFILTAVDAGTRVGRFLLQEIFGVVAPKFNDKGWWPGIIATSVIFTFAWGYLLYTGSIGTIWPLFGMSNQLLAALGLFIGTVMIIRMGKARYAWITAVPAVFMVCVTMWAGYLQITTVYLPHKQYLLTGLAIAVMCLVAMVIIGVIKRVINLLGINRTIPDQYGDPVLEVVQE